MKHSHDHLNCKLIPEEEKIMKMSQLLKVAADPTRLKILLSLLDGEKNVCCIQELLDKSQSLISHQLRVLKENHLVKTRNDKNRVYYELSDDHVIELLKVTFDHIEEE